MIVYKITNKINGKCYIGQTIRTLEERFNRHKKDALSNKLDTHFARALRKYGPDNFYAEIIEEVDNQELLTKREYYWINFYNSVKNGYNETNSMLKSGGNTYLSKTDEEMEIIKEKIRQTKIGGKNPAAKKVKCKNEQTQEEFHFNSLSEMQKFFNETNHNFITRRCNNSIKYLYKGVWNIAYEEDDYENKTIYKNNARAKQINIIDESGNEKFFPTYSSAEKEYNFPKGSLSKKQKQINKKEFMYRKYKIILK